MSEDADYWKRKYIAMANLWLEMFILWLEDKPDMIEYFRPQLERILQLAEGARR